ncbi:MAG: hypothetical protein STSR0008_15310 [Ignavibacterium sp.]
MKNIILILIVSAIIISPSFAQYTGTGSSSKTTKVKPYIKKDGTFIKEHHRTETNSYNLDNYKAKNNYNPYTGKVGTNTYKTPNNSLYKSSYKSTLPKVKTDNSYKIKSYKPKKFKIK